MNEWMSGNYFVIISVVIIEEHFLNTMVKQMVWGDTIKQYIYFMWQIWSHYAKMCYVWLNVKWMKWNNNAVQGDITELLL